MITQITQTVITTANGTGISDDVDTTDIRREVRMTVPCRHRVTLELLGRSMELEIRPTTPDGEVDWQNPEREILTTQFYSASADVIASAVVQYVARQHGTLESNYAGEREKEEAKERLERIAGAMGLTYGQRVVLPGEV
jgi:hypothetical protein